VLIDLLNSVRTSIRTSTFFSDFDRIWCVGRPRPDMRTSVASTQSKVKVTGLLDCRKLHFSRSISSTILACSSKLMVDSDRLGPSLLACWSPFLNFLLEKLSHDLKLDGMSILQHLTLESCMMLVPCVVHADMTLTRSKIKVTEHLNFEKLQFSKSLSSASLLHSSKLIVDHAGMGPCLQLVRASFLNFFPRWRSRDFEVSEMLIITGIHSVYLPEARSLLVREPSAIQLAMCAQKV